MAPVTYLGRISYSVYLIQLVVLIEVGEYLHGEVAVGLAAATISLLYAACSWHLLEQPILEGRVGVRVLGGEVRTG